ncbi:MAG: TlpA disulfide reductase family protein [Planctomycetota bacterium]
MLSSSNRILAFATYLLVLPGLMLVSTAGGNEPESSPMRLRLHEGNFSRGMLVPSDVPGRFGWQAEGFVAPFHFDVRALRSVSLVENPPNEDTEPGVYQFESTNGTVFYGRLRAIGEKQVVVENEIFGLIKINRKNLATMSDASFAGQIVYQGPINGNDWKGTSDKQWDFEAGTLISESQGSVVVGNVGLPPKARIDFSMTWTGDPDFVFSFGTSAKNIVSRADQVPAAGRLEVWDKQLALVREVEGGADVALVSDLDGAEPRLKLTVLIDQVEGLVTVCDSHGRPLETVSATSSRTINRDAVHLVNHGPKLVLESFEVREWDGKRRIAPGSSNGKIINDEGNTLDGAVYGFDSERKVLLIESRSEETPDEIELAKVKRADFSDSTSQGNSKSKESNESEEPGDTSAEEAGPAKEDDSKDDGSTEEGDGEESKKPESTLSSVSSVSDDFVELNQKVEEEPEGLVEVILLDRSRFIGRIVPSGNDMLIFEVDGVEADGNQLTCRPDQLRGVIGRTRRFTDESGQHRMGTLKLGESQLAGYLNENCPEGSETAIFWRPYASDRDVELSPEASGAIVYRKLLPRIRNNPKNEEGLVPMLNKFLGPAQEPSKVRAQRDVDALQNAREIMFRTGDAIDGVVKSIDERGMQFISNQTTTEFAKNTQIQSVNLNARKSGPQFKKELLQRLRTVPRRMKDDPPTHLFLSINGDYLRGRLVTLNNGVATVEIALEIQEIPTNRIAQIIWLHDKEWGDDEEAVNGEDEAANGDVKAASGEPEAQQLAKDLEPFQIHAIGATDKGLTFIPNSVADNAIRGTSDLLGDCGVNILKVNQILFGRDIGDRVRDFNNDPWVLALAQYPKIYTDEGGEGDPLSGQDSELVGATAAEFGLKTLDGEVFQLSKNRDRVVVLDFWASWCGPCMQTMPLVEEAVAEFGFDKVNLVAINLQEGENRIQAAVERLKLKDATVLMDVDGEVAAAYQANAIPQTVIINKEGVITHVFVGGGARFVNNFKAAMKQVLGIEDEPAAE